MGEYNAETDIDCDGDICADPIQHFRPADLIWPENYNMLPFKHDVAVVKLNRMISITGSRKKKENCFNKHFHKMAFLEWVLPICLPYGDMLTTDLTGTTAEIAGWGLTDSDNTAGTPYLQQLKVTMVVKCFQLFISIIFQLPIVPLSICSKLFEPVVLGTEQLCAGGELGKDACGGDSGGPLIKVCVFFSNICVKYEKK